ncbi:O-methylsterigmatocystin oxidoreductase [Grifola frondosa]|uniref:O-methylsterigmatocystin oxidoreductase n=1 Tax=Grifola frondosa TaxID=5627 RepID=A0A1C7MT43_GRIFR|nr:O-methylsterigmatocystin oxidoreductase [Grifola frondosa]
MMDMVLYRRPHLSAETMLFQERRTDMRQLIQLLLPYVYSFSISGADLSLFLRAPKAFPSWEISIKFPEPNLGLTFMKCLKNLHLPDISNPDSDVPAGEICCYHVLGRTIIVLNSVQAVDAFFTKRSSSYTDKPAPKMAELWAVFSGLSSTLPFMALGTRFSNARKQFHFELNPRALRNYDADIEEASRRLVQGFAAEAGCRRLDELIDKQMSTGYGGDGDDDSLLSSIKRISIFGSDVLGGSYALLDRLPFLCYLPRWLPGLETLKVAHYWRRQVSQLAETTMRLARDSLKSASSTSSYMGNAFGRTEDYAELDNDEFKLVALTMTAGGMLIVQSAMLTFLFAMSRFPEVQRRAQAELSSVIGRGRLPAMADRHDLPYINALVLEVLRWIPVAPLGKRLNFPTLLYQTSCTIALYFSKVSRNVTEDDEYMGYRIPKGAILIANQWAVSRDPAIYEEADCFRPERFLHQSSDADVQGVPKLSYFFGYGKSRIKDVDCILTPRGSHDPALLEEYQ